MDEPMLRVRDVSVHVGALRLVGPISFEASRGAMTCLLGRNGSGKTTVLRAVAGLAPYGGSVTVAGDEIRTLAPAERARHVAYVPQQSMLAAGLSVRSVVAQGRFGTTGRTTTKARDPIVETAMERTDVVRFAERRFPTLSLGEQRRVLVARALATGSGCLLLDEPDAYLDVGQRVRLFGLLRELRDDGFALVVVVHALTHARENADVCVVIDDGLVAASGTPAEALAPPILREVFAVDAVEGAAPRYVLPASERP